MRLLKKRGLPFALHRVRRRGPLAAGALALIVTAALLGQTVVTVEVTGSPPTSGLSMARELELAGLREGMWRGSVDVKAVEQRLLLARPDVGWVAVNLSFGRAEVLIRRRDASGAAPVPAGACIVSRADAQITSITLTSGEALVQPGDTVSVGQPLVLPGTLALDGSWAQAAQAVVLGRTARVITLEQPVRRVVRSRTGSSVVRRSLSLFGLSLPLGAGGCGYRYYDTLSWRDRPELFSVSLPPDILCTQYFEVEQRSERVGEQLALSLLRSRLAELERSLPAGARVLGREESFSATPTLYTLSVSYLCEEELGTYVLP